MLTYHLPQAVAFEPDDLSMLQRVFDHACLQRHVSSQSPAAARIAATLFDLFQHGIRHEKQLVAMLIGVKFP